MSRRSRSGEGLWVLAPQEAQSPSWEPQTSPVIVLTASTAGPNGTR